MILINIKLLILGQIMAKLGKSKSAFKVQRALGCELPGMSKPGALERRNYPPGQHGQNKGKVSSYGIRLKEKQKILFHYGLREEQLRRFVKKAKANSSTDWISTLIGYLETRLDNLVFRLGFAPSIPAARQLVTHGKVYVDGKRLNIGSAQVEPNSVVSLSDKAYAGNIYQQTINQPRLPMPAWLQHEQVGQFLKGKVVSIPGSDAVPFQFDGKLVAEFYTNV